MKKTIAITVLFNCAAGTLVERKSVDDVHSHKLSVTLRPQNTVLSYIDKSSAYQQIFNPTWVEASAGTNGKKGILARTQDCVSEVGGECVFCGGSAEKSSFLTFVEQKSISEYDYADSSTVVFGPYDSTDSWGTEDPRMQYNVADETYYMFYTAYNGEDIFLSLATSKNPTSADGWTRHGAVFPDYQNSKSGALLLRDEGENFLFWGDHDIRAARSTNLTRWGDIGDIIVSPRENYFDSQLTESGPPPMKLSSGDYLFFYNSATLGWPNEENTAYHVGWVILDAEDPTKIKDRSSEPLLSPQFPWETGEAPYTCNVPNVVFLEAAFPLGGDKFQVFFGGADATIGTAVVSVEIL